MHDLRLALFCLVGAALILVVGGCAYFAPWQVQPERPVLQCRITIVDKSAGTEGCATQEQIDDIFGR